MASGATVAITSPAPGTAVDLTSNLSVDATGAGKTSTDDWMGLFVHQSIDYEQATDFPHATDTGPPPSGSLNGYQVRNSWSDGSNNFTFNAAWFAALTNGATFHIGLNITDEVGGIT